MKIFIPVILLYIVFNNNVIVAQATIVKEQSKVNFTIGNIKIRNVEGSFGGMKGEIIFKPNDLTHSNFNVCIDATTINTGNEKRDHHLKTVDFFYVEKFPVICFQSLSVEKIKEGYSTSGNLTMHGITKKVNIPFSFDGKIFKGTLNLKRLDYEVGHSTSTFMVSDDVFLTINCIVN